MKLESVKTTSDFPIGKKLEKAELFVVDGTNKAVELTFEDGHFYRLGISNYSDFTILVPAKPKLVERHKVSAILLGKNIDFIFLDHFDAKKCSNHLENTSNVTDVKLEKIQIPEDESVIFNYDEIPF